MKYANLLPVCDCMYVFSSFIQLRIGHLLPVNRRAGEKNYKHGQKFFFLCFFFINAKKIRVGPSGLGTVGLPETHNFFRP